MRRHIYWKTYEEYLKWSFSPLKQFNLVTKEVKGLNSKKNRVRAMEQGSHLLQSDGLLLWEQVAGCYCKCRTHSLSCWTYYRLASELNRVPLDLTNLDRRIPSSSAFLVCSRMHWPPGVAPGPVYFPASPTC